MVRRPQWQALPPAELASEQWHRKRLLSRGVYKRFCSKSSHPHRYCSPRFTCASPPPTGCRPRTWIRETPSQCRR